jgi:hypothetical protein
VLLVIEEAGKRVRLLSERHIVNFIAKESLKQNFGALEFAVTAAMTNTHGHHRHSGCEIRIESIIMAPPIIGSVMSAVRPKMPVD